MGALAIAGLVFSLVETFGPKAKDIYDDWTKTVPPGTEPTAEDWAVLRKKIDDHNPDTY
jgi:hypothetical protein